jgi:hypothetical protein
MCPVSPHFLHHIIQTPLIDGSDSISRNLQSDPFPFFGEEETFGLQIRQKPSLRLNIGVRNVVSTDGLFTCYLTYSSHYLKFWDGKGQIFLTIFKKILRILTD